MCNQSLWRHDCRTNTQKIQNVRKWMQNHFGHLEANKKKSPTTVFYLTHAARRHKRLSSYTNDHIDTDIDVMCINISPTHYNATKIVKFVQMVPK